jgi:hypothetical protein
MPLSAVLSIHAVDSRAVNRIDIAAVGLFQGEHMNRMIRRKPSDEI